MRRKGREVEIVKGKAVEEVEEGVGGQDKNVEMENRINLAKKTNSSIKFPHSVFPCQNKTPV